MTAPPPGPPPGWYPDPGGGGGTRWWDGFAWTHDILPPPAAVPGGYGTTPQTTGLVTGPYVPGPSPYPGANPFPGASPYPGSGGSYPVQPSIPAWHAVEEERRFSHWGRWAVVALAAAGIVSAALYLAYAAEIATIFHLYREIYDAARTGSSRPTLQNTVRLPVALDLPALVTVPALILLLVWLYRAAKAARWLGLPARRSPGWGVGCWFVPVVNFWFPYQTIRDCLPPGHPGRRRVLGFWLAWIVGTNLVSVTLVVSPFSRPAGAALLTVTAVLLLVAAVQGYRTVVAIADVHRGLAGS